MGAKIIPWFDHLWTRLLLVLTQTTEQRHQLTWFQSEHRAYATDTNDRFSRAEWKYTRTRGTGSSPIIFRIIIEKSYFSNDSNSSKSKKKKRDKKKKRRKHKKQDSSGSSLSNYDLSDNSNYRCKQRKKKIHWEKDPIKLCARLTEKLLTTAYKSKIIKFKLDEDGLQRRIYVLTFVESLEMIFSKYK